MPRNDHGVSTLIIILIVSVILAGLVAFLVFHQHRAVSRTSLASATRPALSADEKAYLPSLDVRDLHVSAAVNFLGQTVTYLDGSVTNEGAKPVRRLDLELTFVDMVNQVVLSETAHPLAGRTTPLPPGGTQTFRVTFDHVPGDWNQAPPAAKVVYVEF